MEFARPMPAECLGELRAKDREVLTLSAFSSSGDGVGAIMDVNRFSSFEKLIHSTAYLLLFLGILRSRTRGTGEETYGLTQELKQEAEVLWIREVQKN